MHGKTTKIITAITSASATRNASRLGRNRHGFGLPSHIDAISYLKAKAFMKEWLIAQRFETIKIISDDESSKMP